MLRKAHQVGDLVGKVVDALLEPKDGKDDVREVGYLLDVKHLANGQIDLDTGAYSQGSSHFLRKNVVSIRLGDRSFYWVLQAERRRKTDASLS